MKKKVGLFSLVSKNEILLSFITFIISMTILVTLYVFARAIHIDFGKITKDTAAIFGAPGFYGFLSNLGISFWGASAMSFLLAWYNGKFTNQDKTIGKLTLYFGLLSGLLYVDDFFMLHDYMIIRLLKLPGSVLIIFYGVTVMYLVIRNFKIFMQNGLIYIVGSFGFLGISAIVDSIHDKFDLSNAYLYEDGAKFIGICFWLLFSLTFSLKQLKEVRKAT